MTKFLELLNSTCGAFVGWFDHTFRALTELVTQLANVAVRVLLAYALYAIVFQDMLVKIAAAF